MCHPEGPRKSGRKELNGTLQILVSVDMIIIQFRKEITGNLLETSKEVCLELNTVKLSMLLYLAINM
jgi:hypothetical protein